MSQFIKIKDFKKYRDKSDSCYSIYWIDTKVSDAINQLKDIIANLNKKIKNNFKRKTANDILFNLRVYLENNYKPDDILNNIFLANKSIEDFILEKEELLIFKEWNLKKFYLSYSDRFDIDYLYNLFTKEKIWTALKIINQDAQILEITENKSRIIYNGNISGIDINTIKLDLICGISSEVKKLDGINKNLNNQEILQKIKENKILKNHLELDIILNNLENPKWKNKLIFGKNDIANALKYCEIKTLFCSTKNYKKIQKSLDDINFEIIIIDKLKNGDTGDMFKINYDGLLGIKYY